MREKKSLLKAEKQKSLRAKIIRISCTFVLLALLLGDMWIYAMNYTSLYREGRHRAYRNMQSLMEEIGGSDVLGMIDRNTWKYLFTIYMKSHSGNVLSQTERDYNLCFEVKEWEGQAIQVREIYNHTVFSYDDLKDLSYKFYDNTEGLSYFDNVSYAPLSWGGRRYLIVRAVSAANDLHVFHIEDITDMWENLKDMVWVLLIVTVILTVSVGFLQTLVLRSALAPLKALNETTKRMAQNMYDRRVEVMRDDEIGELAESFNAMADAVEARTRNLEESERRKTLLMGNLTHELKTPMTAISGYAETLLTTRLTEEDRQEALHYIRQECGRLERLSKKMMKLLSLETASLSEAPFITEGRTGDEAENDDFIMKEVSVETLFREAERVCGKAIADKHIVLEQKTHGERFFVEEDLMAEVLINLLDNAVKASVEGGRVILRADGDTISVQDFGCGIPKEETERVLEPFYMVDKSRSRKSGGAGLGLSIVSMIVKLHRGSLSIQSEEGRGTTVELTMSSPPEENV